MAKKIKVAILGGGIGGMSATHQLAELAPDIEVHLYEAGAELGGKARSQRVPGTGTNGRADLPGEHGFRFFPAWYRHIPDTMGRIPRPGGGTVADSLIGCTQMAMAEPDGSKVHHLRRHAPRDAREATAVVSTLHEVFAEANIPPGDIARFGLHVLDFLTTCEERRRGQYELVSFYDFIDGPAYSERFQRYLNSCRFMVAMDMRRGSACTIAGKLLHMLLDFTRPAGTNDRVLDGPTSPRWIEPWEAYLRARGVHIHRGSPALGLRVDRARRRVTGIDIGGEPEPIRADHYVLAMPLERVQPLLTDDLVALDASLLRMRRARRMTSWMVGAQYYLREDVPICDGHVAYPASPWALSSISQASFWDRGRPSTERFHHRYGDGTVRGLLSVDISDWEVPAPRLGRSAARCTSREEVLRETWEQLKEALNHGERILLSDANLVASHLDEHVRFDGAGVENDAPLLIHPPGSWYERPPAVLEGIENLLLAADYVQTDTDLATMESADEAARRAVNGLLEREGRQERAALFSMSEQAGPLFQKAKEIDRWWWTRRKRAAPPIAPRPGPYRAEGGPTLDEIRRYEAELAVALEAAELPVG